jgi:hypothetical protein
MSFDISSYNSIWFRYSEFDKKVRFLPKTLMREIDAKDWEYLLNNIQFDIVGSSKRDLFWRHFWVKPSFC